jgi:hypothetical protein
MRQKNKANEVCEDKKLGTTSAQEVASAVTFNTLAAKIRENIKTMELFDKYADEVEKHKVRVETIHDQHRRGIFSAEQRDQLLTMAECKLDIITKCLFVGADEVSTSTLTAIPSTSSPNAIGIPGAALRSGSNSGSSIQPRQREDKGSANLIPSWHNPQNTPGSGPGYSARDSIPRADDQRDQEKRQGGTDINLEAQTSTTVASSALRASTDTSNCSITSHSDFSDLSEQENKRPKRSRQSSSAQGNARKARRARVGKVAHSHSQSEDEDEDSVAFLRSNPNSDVSIKAPPAEKSRKVPQEVDSAAKPTRKSARRGTGAVLYYLPTSSEDEDEFSCSQSPPLRKAAATVYAERNKEILRLLQPKGWRTRWLKGRIRILLNPHGKNYGEWGARCDVDYFYSFETALEYALSEEKQGRCKEPADVGAMSVSQMTLQSMDE